MTFLETHAKLEKAEEAASRSLTRHFQPACPNGGSRVSSETANLGILVTLMYGGKEVYDFFSVRGLLLEHVEEYIDCGVTGLVFRAMRAWELLHIPYVPPHPEKTENDQ